MIDSVAETLTHEDASGTMDVPLYGAQVYLGMSAFSR